MKLRFTKMHGLGNDFVVFDAVRQQVTLEASAIRRLADRHFGIGCDQVLVVEPPRTTGADFRYRIFNADGGEVEQCGNGARCFARFVYEEGLTDRRDLTVETLGGVIHPRIEANGQVTVNMGVPSLAPEDVPFHGDRRQAVYTLAVGEQQVECVVLSVGNPHAVQFVPDVEQAPVATQGALIARHKQFPRGVNAGFAQICNRSYVRLRVYERGVGETLACGTGACAAVVAGRVRGLLAERVRVDLPGGALEITWSGEGAAILMTGPATRVYDGIIDVGAP